MSAVITAAAVEAACMAYMGADDDAVAGVIEMRAALEAALPHITNSEIARLRAELDNAAAAAVANMSLACEKEREADALRKVIGEVTQCLADTVNEVGGWAVEEVIEAGMTAAMGADA